MKKFDPVIYVEDDGLIIPEIGIWGLEKYKLMGAYCDIFTAGMKSKWEQLVYIDLFAGAGFARLKNDTKVLKTSSLIAASIPYKFTKYIVSEYDQQKLDALKQRMNNNNSDLDISYVQGDSNRNVDTIISLIPKENNALRFCFVDPFSLNLEFETIKRISEVGRVDFLILLALQMDANRNFNIYVQNESNKIDKFIGNVNWREPFNQGKIPQKDFMRYLADCYDKNMSSLGYIVDSNLKYIVKNDSNLPLYYLAFYSKHKRGNDFYTKIEKYQNSQGKLF